MLLSVLKNIFLPKPAVVIPKQAAPTIDFGTVTQERGGRIIWFGAASEGDALTVVTREIMTLFEQHASDIKGIDLNASDWVEQLQDAIQVPVWFAISCFGVGQEMSVNRAGEPVNLWEICGIPFVRLYGDIPAYFPDRHVGDRRNSINAYFDQGHRDFYCRWFPERAFSILLPPIVIEPIPLESVRVNEKLAGKIVFPKNGNNPGQLLDYWDSSLPAEVAKALKNVAEEACSKKYINNEANLDDLLVCYAEGLSLDLAADRATLCFLVAQVDDYVRRVKSTMIGETLLDLPVIIRGRFWDHLDFRGKRAVYDPDSDYLRTQRIFDQAPAIVDMSPNTSHHPHDRIRRAVGRGTAFLTNRQAYFDAVMPCVQKYTFDFEREAIHGLVEYYVTHPRDAIELGFEQAKVLRSVFDSSKYVETVLTAVDFLALRLKGRPIGTQNFVDFPPRKFGENAYGCR